MYTFSNLGSIFIQMIARIFYIFIFLSLTTAHLYAEGNKNITFPGNKNKFKKTK